MVTKRQLASILAVLLIGVFGTGVLYAQAEDPYEIQSARGKLTAVNLDWDTVVVEVPVAGKQLTVAGELAAGANVTKNKQLADLKDLVLNETVKVTWRVTDKGHNILELHQP